MQREFPEVPLVGVGAVIIEDSRVVLVKRLHAPLQAEWSIPGGVLEVGELVRDAAIARLARKPDSPSNPANFSASTTAYCTIPSSACNITTF